MNGLQGEDRMARTIRLHRSGGLARAMVHEDRLILEFAPQDLVVDSGGEGELAVSVPVQAGPAAALNILKAQSPAPPAWPLRPRASPWRGNRTPGRLWW